MKGKYITTNIVLACLASASAARKLPVHNERLRTSEAKNEAVKIAAASILIKDAA